MARLIIVVLLSFTLTGCISYESNGDNDYSDYYSVVNHLTTESWLYQHMGQPHSKRLNSNGNEVLHYRYDSHEKTHVSFLILFNMSNEETQTRDVYFEVKDGVVIDHWDD